MTIKKLKEGQLVLVRSAGGCDGCPLIGKLATVVSEVRWDACITLKFREFYCARGLGVGDVCYFTHRDIILIPKENKKLAEGLFS